MNQTEYETLRRKIDRYSVEADRRFKQPNGWTAIPKEELHTLLPAATNEEKSAVEVFEFKRDRPRRYFVYVSRDMATVTTWPGEKLGTIYSVGFVWRDGFGGERVPIKVRGINGVYYYGTFYKSAGDYARLTAYVEQPQ